MNTLTGLKKLLAKLGGDPTKVDNNGDAIDAIAEAYVDHEGDKLPVVTTADNGRNLSVVEGSWTKEKVIVISATLDPNNPSALGTVTFPTEFPRGKLEKWRRDGYKLSLKLAIEDGDTINMSMVSYVDSGENIYGATTETQGIWFEGFQFSRSRNIPPTIADPNTCTKYSVFIGKKSTGEHDTLFYTNSHFPQ